MTQKEGPGGETDSARHWHIICTQFVTIGAAALAAAFLVTEPEKALTSPMPTVNAVKLMCAGITTFAFGILLIAAGTTLFRSGGNTAAHARVGTGWAFCALAGIAAGMALAVISIITIPPETTWPLTGTHTITLTDETWMRIEELVGPSGSPEEKVRTLLEQVELDLDDRPGSQPRESAP